MLPLPKYPCVYIEELPIAVHRIAGVATPIPAFVGWAPRGPVNQATLVQSWGEFQTQFGGGPNYMANAVQGFFDNGGQQLYVVRVATMSPQGDAALTALLKAALKNIPLRWRHH